MIIFKGKERAEAILDNLKEQIEQAQLKLKLGVISVGVDAASDLFIRNKKRAALRVGINIDHFKFTETVTEKEIIRKIKELNKDNMVQGIVVQLPLTKHLNAKKILKKIDFRKDVDGFHRKTKFISPLILAIFHALEASTDNLECKKVLAVVNSDFFGRVLRKNLKDKKIKIEYLLNFKKKAERVNSKKDNDALVKIKKADTIITVCGQPGLIKGDMIKEGVILVDAGISILPTGKTIGDIDYESVKNKAAFLTPVPGGIGPLTVAYLLENVYLSKVKKYSKI